MNAAENNIIQLLTGKPTLQDATVDELQALVGKYPYFSLGQLLLTKKLGQVHPENFAEQLQYCAVYFQDITWLQGRLHNGETTKGIITQTVNQKGISGLKVIKNEEPVANNTVFSKALTSEQAENSNLTTLPAEDVLSDFTLQMDDVKDEPELPPLDEEELANESIAEGESAAKIADVLQHQVEDFKAPVNEKTELPISTEPYHTIDYFASQGIKVDPQHEDAFARKVHTFTDWLKQMKRISHYPTDLGSDPDMENYVQSIADTSNQPNAVDTEAMAEVLVKQGKPEKAIEVYEKLSLQNPAKTAYFAAKINHLKAL